jgi:hypothetical protein
MTDLNVSSEGLRAASGMLGAQAGAIAGEVAGLTGTSTQVSVAAVQGIAAHMRSWQTDESGYHETMAATLTSASSAYEKTDHQGGERIGGVM